MNFRFAHYDPPQKKTAKPRVSASKAEAKTLNRPSKASLTQHRRKSSSSRNEQEDQKRVPPLLRKSSTDDSTCTSLSSGSTISSSTISNPPALEEPPVEINTVIYTYLGQGRLDPFKIYPVEDVPVYVEELLDHALNRKWPHVSPSDPNATKHDWLQCALSSPVAFYALSFAASQHLNYLNLGIDKTPNADLMRLSYKTEAVKLINRALTNLNSAPIPDSLLIAILSLGAHGHNPVPHTSTASLEQDLRYRGPKSPLASAQMLDFYGHIDQETAHMSALRTLLAHNKGVGGIKLAGLAGALALGDLLHSTITHQRPSLNVTRPVREIAAVAQFLPAEGQVGGYRAGVFPARVGSLPSFKSTGNLLRTLTAAKALTAALDYNVVADTNQDPGRQRRATDVLHISEQSLIHARNDVHHSLLGLPPANSLWGREFALYEVLRVAGLIYSDLVLFPLPAETGVRARYARMMREAMEGGRVEGLAKEEAGTVMWCCLLGAVAAAETRDLMISRNGADDSKRAGEVKLGDRDWFVGKVRICAAVLGVGLSRSSKGWSEVREVCQKYLWWDDVCDPIGRGVWEEVMALQSALLSLDIEKMAVPSSKE